MNLTIDEVIASVVQFGEDNDFSVVLNSFNIIEIASANSLKVVLNFNMLVVERGINRFLTNLIALRRFIYLELPKLHNIRCTIDNGNLQASPVELSTNVTEQFGTAYSLVLPVTVFVTYL